MQWFRSAPGSTRGAGRLAHSGLGWPAWPCDTERTEFRAKKGRHHEFLCLIQQVAVVDLSVEEIKVDSLEGLCSFRVDKETVHCVQKVVARGPRDRPIAS